MLDKKLFTYSCGHQEFVPDDGNWDDSSNSPCGKCYTSYAPDIPIYTEDECNRMEQLQQEIEDYGFDKRFEV